MEKKKQMRSATRKQNQIPGFLRKTFAILENPEYKDIITWSQDGKSFVVLKPNDFSEKVLPKYFKHNKFASFVRQLNMYDFHKLKHDTDDNEWSHQLFKRGQPQLLSEIKRKITENPQQENQVVVKRETDQTPIFQDINQLKTQYDNIEKICTVLLMQNQQFFLENSQLKQEFQKREEKQQQLVETIFSIVFYQLGPQKFKEIQNYFKKNEMLSAVDYDQSYTNQSSINIKDSSQNSGALQTMEQWNKKDLAKIMKKFMKINKTKKLPNKKLNQVQQDNQLELFQDNNQSLVNNMQQSSGILKDKPVLEILKDPNGYDIIQDIYSKNKKIKVNPQQNQSEFVEQEETKSQVSKSSDKQQMKLDINNSAQMQSFFPTLSISNQNKQQMFTIPSDISDLSHNKFPDSTQYLRQLPQPPTTTVTTNQLVNIPSLQSLKEEQESNYGNLLQSPYISYNNNNNLSNNSNNNNISNNNQQNQFDLHPQQLLRAPSIFESLSPKIGGLNNNPNIEQMSDYFQIDENKEDAKSQL